MATPAFLAQPTIQRIPTLIEEVCTYQVLVPRFQRPFIWTDEQRVELMRSIYAGLPIGSLMVWRTKAHDELSFYRLPGSQAEEPEKGGVRQFLLDGHQRVTTLVTALAVGDPGKLEAEVAEGYREVRSIYFDLESSEDEGDSAGFVLERKRPTRPKTWLPLSILFDSFALHEFQAGLVKAGHPREVVNRTDKVVSRFKDYSIPVVPIVTDDIELATKSFQRVNSAGTKMSEVHMASALAFSRFDLNGKITEVKAALGSEGWHEIDEQRVLDTCKSLLGLEIRMRTLTNLVDALRSDESVLDRAQRALITAARFLRRRCDIHGPQTLPYSFQIVLLAAVLDPFADDPDDDTHDDVLCQWLWATTYAEYFAGISSTGLRRAREHLTNIIDSEFEAPPDLNRRVFAPGRFDFRSARTRAMALTMAELYPADARGNQRDRFSLLDAKGANAVGQLFTRDELGGDPHLTESVENRILGAPRELNQIRSKIRDLEFDREQLASHGIDREGSAALRKHDYRAALRHRRAVLVTREREFVENELGFEYDDSMQ